MSSYNQKKSVKLKTTLTPIDVYRQDIGKGTYKKKAFINTEGEEFKPKVFVLNLFTKELNPLIYYVAEMGITKTINYFSMKGIIDVTENEYNTDINYYFKVNKKLFVEVDKRFFNESEFIKTFTFLIYDLFNARTNIKDIDNVSQWIVKLGSLFTSNTKNQLNKGENVLVSFSRVLDNTTKRTLLLAKRHLASTHSLIRYMLQNYTDLRKKDNHSLDFKRVRVNEALAYYFIRSMSKRINNLLNKGGKITIESIERIFNFNPDELFKLLLFGKSPCPLLRYGADINDFQALNALRITVTGESVPRIGSNSYMKIYLIAGTY